MEKVKLVDVGFVDEMVSAGTHICQVYSDEKDRDNSLFRFLLKGLEAGELMACFSDNLDKGALAAFFGSQGASLDQATEDGVLSIRSSGETYFSDGVFDPDEMLELLNAFHGDSVARGCPGARVIGEMTPEIGRVEGGDRLLEYESRVSILLRDHPVTTICQYDAREFDGATIMDVLKVHPRMIVNGGIVNNPFYVPPEEILGGRK